MTGNPLPSESSRPVLVGALLRVCQLHMVSSLGGLHKQLAVDTFREKINSRTQI